MSCWIAATFCSHQEGSPNRCFLLMFQYLLVYTHAEGSSYILFLRKKETPDIPYYTIEIEGTEIVQWYGIKDTKPDKCLVEGWLKDFTDSLLNKHTKNVLQVAV